MDKIKICHLYPDLLNLYGDRGNILAMKQRLKWRGIDSEIIEVSIGDKFNHSEYDIVFIGGGQDFEQEVLISDLSKDKIKSIKESVLSETVFLAICGGYQLLGTHYTTWEGSQFDFTGIIDIHTVGGKKRMIGDYAFSCEIPALSKIDIVGFENHSGKTYLGKNVKPLGKVIKGFGNNGEDKTAGAIFKNVICTYSHGPVLPKNPELCDYLLITALNKKYGNYEFKKLDDKFENSAKNAIKKRFK